jgi:hypothetical protein
MMRGLINLIRSGFICQYDDDLKLPAGAKPSLIDEYKPLVQYAYSDDYDPGKTKIP